MALYTATVEAELAAPGVRVQVTTFNWPTAHATEQRMTHYALGLTISPGRIGSQVRYSDTELDSGAFAELGRLFLIPAGVNFAGRAGAFRSRSVFCRFEPDWFEDVTGLGHDWDPDMLSACINIGDARLMELVSRLGQEAMAPGLASSNFAEGLGMLTAVELMRRLRSASKAKSAGARLLPWQMRRITNYFEGLSTYAPDLAEIASLCGVGERHLRRLFKETTNLTIYEYARDVWTAKAKRMLCGTDLPLKEISAQLGFSDPGGFSVAFRRAAGVAPRRFRQQSREA